MGTLNIRCRIIIRTQKGIIILTTTQIRCTEAPAFMTPSRGSAIWAGIPPSIFKADDENARLNGSGSVGGLGVIPASWCVGGSRSCMCAVVSLVLWFEELLRFKTIFYEAMMCVSMMCSTRFQNIVHGDRLHSFRQCENKGGIGVSDQQ